MAEGVIDAAQVASRDERRDRRYRLTGLIEFDIALVGGKLGRGALPSLNTFAAPCQQQARVTPPRSLGRCRIVGLDQLYSCQPWNDLGHVFQKLRLARFHQLLHESLRGQGCLTHRLAPRMLL